MQRREDDERTNAAGHGNEAGIYRVRIRGSLGDRWSAWFDGLSLSPQQDGTTVIEGPVADQAALHGLLQRVQDLGLELVSVIRSSPE